MSNTTSHLLTRRFLFPISLLLTLVGFGLRAHHLGGDSLWLDEILTMRVVNEGGRAMMLQNDHPPLLYALTWIPVTLLGENEFSARLISLMAGTLAVPILIALGKGMKQPEVGLITALLLALSPFHIKYSQEARHYALLMTLCLASFWLLYRGLKKPTWRPWLAFALVTLVNLYTHYGALLVLASQSVLIFSWMVVQGGHKRYQEWRYPLLAAGIVLVSYLPWVPRLLLALSRNVNTDDVNHVNRHIVPFSAWTSNIFYDFGTKYGLLPYILLGLCICGLFVLAYKRDVLRLGFIMTGLIVPLLFIWVFNISRVANSRYVIYLLPFYLLSAGVALHHFFTLLRSWRLLRVVMPILLVIGLFVVYVPIIAASYSYKADWQGIENQFDLLAEDDDFVIGFSLDDGDGFNGITAALPYYMDRAIHPYKLVSGYKITLETAAELAVAQANSWFVVSTWNSIDLHDLPVQKYPFQPNLYLLRYTEQEGKPLAQTIYLYEQLIPLARQPAPACMLRQNLTVLYLANEEYEKAENTINQALSQCPDPPTQGESPAVLRAAVYTGLLKKYEALDDKALARQNAWHLWQIDRRNELALATLTYENLLDSYTAGKAQIANEALASEPVHVDKFEMPQNGDWGNVLFIHPPTAVSYPLTLPADPVILHSRIAMAPASWTWGGDGATFIVTLQSEDQPPIELFRQHVSNAPEDNDWHEVEISLADYVNQPVTLTLMTDFGPAGNSTGDWAGWATPRLLWEVVDP